MSATARPRTRILAALTTALVAIAGCTPVQEPAPGAEDGAATENVSDSPSSDLIQAALEAGEIDEPTALLYRTWAVFGDRQLPEEFRGSPAPHDIAFLADLSASADSLPLETSELVQPYLKRPADPESAFTDPEGPVTTTISTSDQSGPEPCSQGWTTAAGQGDAPQFRAWVCNDASDDPEAALDAVLAEVEVYAPRIVAEMGPLIPDDPGADPTHQGDDLIDIYVLPTGFLAPYRDSNARLMEENAGGIAMRADPREGPASSAYVLLSAELLDYPDTLAQTVVHELTHVAQFARNWELLGSASGWVYEATAAWAEHHFAPEVAGGVNNRARAMQNSPLPIDSTEGFHPYWAAVWMMYMEQEAGAQSVFDLWSSLETATGEDAAISAIEELLGDLRVHAPTFALRLLGADLPGDPVPTRFAHLDPRIPDGVLPDATPVQVAGAAVGVEYADVPGLGYRFTRVELDSGAGAEPQSIEVSGDFVADAPVHVQAVVSDGDTYRAQQVPAEGGEFCAGGDDFWLILTNTSTDHQDAVSGSLTLTPQGTECAAPEPASSPSPETSGPGTGGTPEPSGAHEPSDPPETAADDPPAVTGGDFCEDLKAFSLRAGGIADLAMLPFSSQDVTDIFDHIDPFLMDLPDGAQEQVEVLRTAAASAADKTAAEAADILDDPEVRQASTSMDHLYWMMCSD